MSIWHTIPELPPLNGLRVSDDLIILNKYNEYILGFFYYGEEGRFISNDGKVIHNVKAWAYLPKYEEKACVTNADKIQIK